MENFYKNSLEKIKEFYTVKIDENNVETRLFSILKNIVDFDCAKIFYLNGCEKSLTYSYNISKTEHSAEFFLSVQGLNFGILELGKNKNFTEEELNVIEACTPIIANILKDIEMNSIIKMQLQMLQDGIHAQNIENRTKNNFISNVSHELRSPLNSILGFTELLHAQFIGKLNAKQLEYIDDIRIAGLHLLTMVNEILDISKIESGTMCLNLTKFSLKRNAVEVINILNPLSTKKKLKITCAIPDNLEINADYTKLQQVFFNLLSNAIKFTQEGGNVDISASETKNYIIISVKDNGCGIDKSFHKKIFDKFVQISQMPDSTGLGLTITNEIIKMHGGKISVKSELNKGSDFIIKVQKI